MFGGPEVSHHQTYLAKDWLSILRTPYPTQNLQRKHRTDLHMTIKVRKTTTNTGFMNLGTPKYNLISQQPKNVNYQTA